MNDKKIREILISYLKTQNSEIRIYQEKSIGNSVCDIMAVTDVLTGYEIKSDDDNYSRLQSQISAYNRFFDQNYIVVGGSHKHSIEEKVPSNWGIMVIEQDGVSVERPAKNGYPNASAQLGILWKLELKNILTKCDLPLYTYKPKDYIISEIISNIDDDIIHKCLIYELMHRDYSLFDAKDYSIYSVSDDTSSVFENIPATDIVDTLSEQNLNDLTLDKWISLYRQAKELRQNKEIRFIEEPEKRTPHKIPYTDIEVSPGAPWINKQIINDFIYYLCNGKESNYPHNYVNYEPNTGYWHIEDKKCYNVFDRSRIDFIYGTSRYNALHIFEAMLNLREIKLYDSSNKYDERATLEALEKQDKIGELFRKWIWEDEDRRWNVEKAYNEAFADFKVKHSNGSKLVFPEMSSEITLYDYQKDAIQRIITDKNTLLAFDVGAGKTYIMIAAAMLMRQSGKSRKNMFVVPNHIVGQWEIMFKKMYPAAKILSVEPSFFKPEMRQKVLSQIKNGDYDGIIIAYSCFERIPLSVDCVTSQMESRLEKIREAMRRGANIGSYTALKRECEYIKKQASELINDLNSAPEEITFDDLEINTLFVDEAHNFKNIEIRTKLKNLRGINTKGSKKCQEMLCKVRNVQENNNGRGVVFATGTPLCNSISDAYTMQLYLQSETLGKMHLDVFDNWVKTFAKPERVCEIDVNSSKFRFVNRFSKFFNLPELSAMFSDIAVFYAVNEKDGIPELSGYDNVTIERSTELTDYMKLLCDRTEKIRSRDVDPRKDNMLKVSTDGRKAALDLRLVGKPQIIDRHTKLWNCVKNVMEIYNSSSDNAQIIFCDVSTPSSKQNFNVYSELKTHLIKEGIPQKEIAFIHNYHTEEKKVKLFEKVNCGEVRILIGSTFKLGTGANVQSKLKAIHHLDVPWRPADMVQREGRILRKGNTNETVRIFRYISEGSFDAYSWQLLETKQKFISQFLTGSTYQRTASDLEENVLTYAQVKALALSNENMKQLAEKQNELQRLRILSGGFAVQKANLKDSIPKLNEQLESLNAKYDITINNFDYLKTISEKEYKAEYQIKKDLLNKEVIDGTVSTEKPLLFFGFSVNIPQKQDNEKPYVFLERNGATYIVKMGKSASGNARRIINFLKSFDSVIDKITKHQQEILLKIKNAEKIIKSKNPYTDSISHLESEIKKLTSEIDKESA